MGRLAITSIVCGLLLTTAAAAGAQRGTAAPRNLQVLTPDVDLPRLMQSFNARRHAPTRTRTSKVSRDPDSAAKVTGCRPFAVMTPHTAPGRSAGGRINAELRAADWSRLHGSR